jgi:hypothetical protein
MIIQMNKLFMTLRSMLDWTAKVFFCVFLLLILDIGVASTSDQNSMNSNTYAATIKDSERRRGPFKFGGKEYTVVLKIKKYVGTSQGFNETVESFSIVDEKGKSLFRNESGRLVEDVMKGCVSRGIILFYSVVPSAPATGVWCQVFASKKGHIVPLFQPLTIHGTIYELPRGSNPNALKLLERETMKFGI